MGYEMTIQEAIAQLEEMYEGVDTEAEALIKEESPLRMEARADRRALAVAIETLSVVANNYPAP